MEYNNYNAFCQEGKSYFTKISQINIIKVSLNLLIDLKNILKTGIKDMILSTYVVINLL